MRRGQHRTLAARLVRIMAVGAAIAAAMGCEGNGSFSGVTETKKVVSGNQIYWFQQIGADSTWTLTEVTDKLVPTVGKGALWRPRPSVGAVTGATSRESKSAIGARGGASLRGLSGPPSGTQVVAAVGAGPFGAPGLVAYAPNQLTSSGSPTPVTDVPPSGDQIMYVAAVTPPPR